MNVEEDLLQSRSLTRKHLIFFYHSVAYYCCFAKELQTELQELCSVDPMIYQPLYELAQVIVGVIIICDSVSAVLIVIFIAIDICYECIGLVKLD